MTRPPQRGPSWLAELSQQLVVALLELRLHSIGTDVFQSACRSAAVTLSAAIAERGGQPLRMAVGGDEVGDDDGATAVAASLQADALLAACRAGGISALVFRHGIDVADVAALAGLLADSTAARELRRHPARTRLVLAAHGIRHVDIECAAGEREHAAAPERSTAGLSEYRALSSFLLDNHVAAARGDELEVERATGVVEQAIAQLQSEPSQLLTLASYDDIDSFTVGHSVRVALLALLVAQAAGADKATLLRVGTAALLHDVGKSRIPAEILLKRGPLDCDERELMAEHPKLGAEILLEQRHLDPTAVGAAFCHHMTPDGRGYPAAGLPLRPGAISRLVRVCDVFEALTAARPYKPPLAAARAYELMLRTRGEFDAGWLRLFVRTVGLYPLGTCVQLADGRQALVVGHGDDPRRPRVVTADGEQLAAGAAGAAAVASVVGTVQDLRLDDPLAAGVSCCGSPAPVR